MYASTDWCFECAKSPRWEGIDSLALNLSVAVQAKDYAKSALGHSLVSSVESSSLERGVHVLVCQQQEHSDSAVWVLLELRGEVGAALGTVP